MLKHGKCPRRGNCSPTCREYGTLLKKKKVSLSGLLSIRKRIHLSSLRCSCRIFVLGWFTGRCRRSVRTEGHSTRAKTDAFHARFPSPETGLQDRFRRAQNLRVRKRVAPRTSLRRRKPRLLRRTGGRSPLEVHTVAAMNCAKCGTLFRLRCTP